MAPSVDRRNARISGGFFNGGCIVITGGVILLAAFVCGLMRERTARAENIACSCMSGKSRIRFSTAWEKIVLWFVFGMTVVLVMSSLYVQWTQGEPESIEVISGIQGRYFLPILPVLYCALTEIKRQSVNDSEMNAAVNIPVEMHSQMGKKLLMMSLIQNLVVMTCIVMSSSFT